MVGWYLFRIISVAYGIYIGQDILRGYSTVPIGKSILLSMIAIAFIGLNLPYLIVPLAPDGWRSYLTPLVYLNQAGKVLGILVIPGFLFYIRFRADNKRQWE